MTQAINNLIQDIKTKTFYAEKIILFGSIARGEIHERSDMDICIVSDEELPPQQRGQMESYFYQMAQNEFSLDFVYCDINKLQNGNKVFERIRQEGRVLYERI